MLQQSEAAAIFVGDLTMSERVVEVGQGWASDIVGIVTGVGLYSVLFSLVGTSKNTCLGRFVLAERAGAALVPR
jgi:hypothetical protein